MNTHIRGDTKTGICKTCNESTYNVRVYCDKCWDKTIQTRIENKKTDKNINKKCKDCGVIKDNNNFSSDSKSHRFIRCKSCEAKNKANRVKLLKEKCIEYKGGCCEICHYNKCISSLDFHHLDPTKKEFSISTKKCNAFGEEIKKELDKCILLCSNCHREEHYREKQGYPSLLQQNHWFEDSASSG
jgi:hypothetical protein